MLTELHLPGPSALPEEADARDLGESEARSPVLRWVALVLWMLLVVLPACGHELIEEWPQGDDNDGRSVPPRRPHNWASSTYPVVGGRPADANLYPATGVLLYALRQAAGRARPMGTMLCSASLIAPDVVIAAAHCQEPRLAEVEMYFSLASDVSLTGPWGMRVPPDAVRVATVSAYPEYERGERPRRVGRVYDIALFYLEAALAAEPVRLPTPERAASLLHVGQPVDIVGYGRRSEWFYGGGDDGQKTWGLSTLSDVGPYELEVGRADDDAYKCFGDSGGPTFVRDEAGVSWMVGVTARGAALPLAEATFGQSSAACRSGGIDTRVDAYYDWIDGELRAKCGSVRRPACDRDAPGLPWR